MQNVMAINYVIDKANSNPNVLPNVTLGFVIVDDCANPMTSLARALQFGPVVQCVRDSCNNKV